MQDDRLITGASWCTIGSPSDQSSACTQPASCSNKGTTTTGRWTN